MNIGNNLEQTNKLEIEKKQNSFLQSTMGTAINVAVDFGLRALLPNFIEDQIIDIKDNLLENGLKDGISKTIKDTIDIGKNLIGIFKGDFKNVNQIQEIFSSGGLVDDMSGVLDIALDNIEKKGVLNSSIMNIIKNGKDIILDSVEKNVQNNISEQLNTENSINKSMNLWEKAYSNKDLYNMEKSYNDIKSELNKLIPIEESINRARKIENIHNLIKNNGNNFDLSKEQIEISCKI